MKPPTIDVTVMQLGRDESVVTRSLRDLTMLFSKLEGEELIERNVFAPKHFADSSTDAVRQFIGGLITVCLESKVDIELAVYMFNLLVQREPHSLDEFSLTVIEMASSYEVPSPSVSAVELAVEQSVKLRGRLGLRGQVSPPDLLWLPPAYGHLFRGGHAISQHNLHYAGQLSLFCPPDGTYYSQIVWHEMLHLCFGCEDCYDRVQNRATCPRLDTCLMQWEPYRSNPDAGPWLCDTQKARVRKGYQNLVS